MLIAMSVFAVQTVEAHAQSGKSVTKPLVTTTTSRDFKCFADALQHEPEQNKVGYVTVGYAILARANAKGGICNAIYEKNQFSFIHKKGRRGPTAETAAIARQMYQDWKNGAPTVEVELQRKLKGCTYFHNRSVYPSWAKKFKKLGGYCGFYAGHHMYRNPNNMVLAYK